MRRCSWLLAILALSLYADVSGQGPAPAGPTGARPGTAVPGAPTPGLPSATPPRDGSSTAAQSGTAIVRGRVLSQDGTPLRRAQVAIASAETQVRRTTTTDGTGRYEFVELPAGRFSVNASKAGYVALQFGQRRPYEAGTPITVAKGETIERVDFALPRGSVIAGRLTDEYGEPIAQAQVQAQRFMYGSDGQRRLTTTQIMQSDDRGEFRLYGLMPGEYVVNAGVRNLSAIASTPNANDSSEGFASTFYPGTVNAGDAQPVSVGVGEEKSIQFSLVASKMARISGSVVDSEGRPASGAQLMLVSRQGTGISGLSAGIVAADGTFNLAGVAAGEHTIEVRPQARAGRAVESASVPVVVGGTDIVGLRITTSKGARVSGRVIWEGTSPRTSTTPVAPRVFPQNADPSRPTLSLGSDPLANGTLDDDGNFEIAGVTGRVFFTLPTPAGWTVKSVTLDGDDVSDTPLDLTGRESVTGLRITLTDKLTSVTGQVMMANGQPSKDYVVVILPAEPKDPIVAARWIRTARPDTNGRFEMRGLRPGRYVATGIESLEQGRQFAPDFQNELRRGARDFSLTEGEAVTLDLRLVTGL